MLEKYGHKSYLQSGNLFPEFFILQFGGDSSLSNFLGDSRAAAFLEGWFFDETLKDYAYVSA